MDEQQSIVISKKTALIVAVVIVGIVLIGSLWYMTDRVRSNISDLKTKIETLEKQTQENTQNIQENTNDIRVIADFINKSIQGQPTPTQ